MDDMGDTAPAFEEPSDELARLARETINTQTGAVDPLGVRERCRRVTELYAQGSIKEGADYFHAAWVLLCGDALEHYDLARHFARRATKLDEHRAWTLLAMAWDRWLVAAGKPQRFGTRIIKQDGRWSLGEVDPAISDYERALYAVPPLYMQRQRAEQLQQQEDSN